MSMSKVFCAKYYQENKERLQKRSVKDIIIYPKKTNDNMVVDEKERLVEYRKNNIKWEKVLNNN